MEHWAADCGQKIDRIFLSETQTINEGLHNVSFRMDNRENPSITSRLNKGMVRGGILAAIIGLFLFINCFIPITNSPASIRSSPRIEPKIMQQDWKVSTVSIPILHDPVMSIKVGTPRSLMLQLKALDLWEIEAREFSKIPPVVFTNFPNRLNELNIDARKKMFLHSLLPVVMIAMAEVQGERAALQMALEKLGNDSTIIFSDENQDWQERLSYKEKIFIRTITEKYRTHQAGELLDRVDVLPVSLVLAQAAFESFWGTSRFAKQGNNLFGMWTWGKQGIIPARREAGKTHKLAVYDSIFDAVQMFVLTLNRLPAYENLRKIRQNSMDSMTIADGLLHYSERGEDYIADVKTIIQYNELTKYDSFVLGNSMNLPPAVKQLASL